MSNIYSIPKKLEDSILRYVKRTYLPERRVNPKTADEFTGHDVKFFARGVAEMSAYFTSERAHLPKNYLNKKELRAGYLLYFLPSNFLKVVYCLEQAHAAERFACLEKVKILDLGSGPGTASLASAHYWSTNHFHPRGATPGVEMVAVDQNTGALHDAKRIIGEFAGDRVKFKTVLADLHGGCRFSKKHAPNWSRGGDLARLISGDPRFRGNDGRPFNIIIAANLISEFRDNEERSLFLNSVMKDLLEDGGILIVIEPALRWTTRNLMKVHDELVFSHRSPATGHCIIAPCLHSLPCPMLKESDRDWCHMYLDWKRPAFIADIDRMIGNRKDYLKFSYLIFSNRQNPPQPPFTKGGISHQSLAASHGLYRVVSAPMRSKGKIELLLCNERGLMHLTRLNKDTSPSNADFDKTARGDVVQYGGGPSLGKNDIFKKLVS